MFAYLKSIHFYRPLAILTLALALPLLTKVPFATAEAADRSTVLRSYALIEPGMSAYQVLAIMGPADEKVSMETSRRAAWRYADVQVVFEEGQVIFPLKGSATNETVAEENKSSESLVSNVSTKKINPRLIKPFNAKQTAAVFSDLMREIPSEDSVSAPGAAGASPAAAPGFGGGAADTRAPMIRPLNRPMDDEDN